MWFEGDRIHYGLHMNFHINTFSHRLYTRFILMNSSKKKQQKILNQHTYYVIQVICIDFQPGKKRRTKRGEGEITLVQLGFELGTLALQGK